MLYFPGKAYPTTPGDMVVKCPVCRKQVPLAPHSENVWEVPFHNDPKGGPCNGTGRKCGFRLVSNKR